MTVLTLFGALLRFNELAGLFNNAGETTKLFVVSALLLAAAVITRRQVLTAEDESEF